MKILDEGGLFSGWAGDTPYFVVIKTGGGMCLIDLDESGWMSEREGLMRAPGEWILFAKRDVNSLDGVPILVVIVHDGDQPYYTKRTIGIAVGPGAGREIAVYGIGKKRLDGQTDRMWVLPNGIVCSGDDVDIIATGMLKSM